jgi:hypothetical protein
VDPTTDADNPSLAAIGGDPYVTWNERGTDGWKVHVKRLVSGAWTLVGDPLNIGLDALEPSIAEVNGTPFVVWRESAASPASEQIHVKQLIGQAWQTVGGVLNVDATKFGLSPTITSIGGVPYVAWKESTAATNYELRVKRLEPDIVSQSASPSPTTATLSAEVDDFGVRLPVGFELGATAVFGTRFSLQTTPGTGVSTLTQAVTGLTPATQYSYRAFGSDTFRQTALGGTQVFTTPVLPAPAVRPVLSNVGQSAKSWRRGSKLATVAARRRPRAPVGTVFSFRLNEDSAVKFAFSRAAVGRKVSGRCVAPTNGNRRKPRCTRRRASGTLTVQGHAGANSLRFQGRLSRTRRLRPGRYTLTITATAQGLTSTPRSLRFTIIR